MGKETKTRIYEIIFWLALIIIALWLVLKAVGIINSPVWVEAIPYASGLFAAGAAFQVLKDTKDNVRTLTKRVGRMGQGLTKVEIEVKHLEKEIKEIKK
ncbi:hypothetical protein KY366_04170 [Candidatus Woesearchaeota archaeon]|nr:hypothetical protein [Candidatus Woesearchaeota archaeon]